MRKFIGEIEYLFIKSVEIEYEYYVQKEKQREEQAKLREQMKQEAEEKKLLEQQKKQIEKEEGKYQTEIEKVEEIINSTEDEEKLNKLQEKIEELKNQLKLVNEKKEEITKLQNGKAGYVYVISNLGSFGDNENLKNELADMLDQADDGEVQYEDRQKESMVILIPI